MPRSLTEIRSIVDVEFSDKTFTLDTLKFPTDSQFIAMVSDATGVSFFHNFPCIAVHQGTHKSIIGVASGGTSAILTVSESNNTSCLPTEKRVVDFFFFLEPQNIDMCEPVNITWNQDAQGSVCLPLWFKWRLICGL